MPRPTTNSRSSRGSPAPRWSFICCYNTKHNNPYKASHHPFYEKLEKVPDSRLKEMGAQLFGESAKFWRPGSDKSMAGGGKTIAR